MFNAQTHEEVRGQSGQVAVTDLHILDRLPARQGRERVNR